MIGFIFGGLGAIAAYIITYSEYAHHYAGSKEPRKIALETALVAFMIFMALSLVVTLAVPYIINK
jgi:hypothetical protein